jgi:hypothetical protein
MLYQENDEYKLMPLIAKYTQYGQAHEQHVANKEDMQAFEEMGHIAGLSFADAAYSPEVVARLAEVKHYPESEYTAVAKYVFDNEVADGTTLAVKKQNQMLEQSVLDLSMMLIGGGF